MLPGDNARSKKYRVTVLGNNWEKLEMLKTEPSGFFIFKGGFAKRKEELKYFPTFWICLQMTTQVPRQREIELTFTNRLISLTSSNLAFSFDIIHYICSIIVESWCQNLNLASVRTTNICTNNMIYVQK